MTLKDIPTYITYKSISTSHKLCSGLCQIVLVFRSLLGVHVHIYTQSTSIYIKYNPNMNLMCKLISINFTFFFCCHLNSGTIKCQKRGWGLMLIYSVLRSWQCFMFTPPPPFPHPQNTMWNLGSMHALMLSAGEHYSDSVWMCINGLLNITVYPGRNVNISTLLI